jgi:DNA topoisomerase IA
LLFKIFSVIFFAYCSLIHLPSTSTTTSESVFLNADLAVRSKVWNDKKLSAHHAIIPTDNMQVNVSEMTAVKYFRLYFLHIVH